MKTIAFLLLCCGATLARAELPFPELPADPAVARVLRAAPEVLAASSLIRAEEANRVRLEAGPHEWSVRLTGQQRRTSPPLAASERYTEWSTALERPLRLPGKAATDAGLGAAGVALAETAYGDALHEASRGLLRAWFAWRRESATLAQWTAQVDLLTQQAGAVERRRQLGDAAQIEAIQSAAALAQAAAQRQLSAARLRGAEEELRRRYPGLPLDGATPAGDPPEVEGDEAAWLAELLEHNHELRLARGEAERARLLAERQRQDRLPDPSFGLSYARERGGEENVVGAYLSIPLPGDARRAVADAGLAQAEAANRRAEAVERRLTSDAAMLYHAARSAVGAWQAASDAAARLVHSAELTARAYRLGEGSLNDLLTARRLANEAQLAASLARLDALEQHARLRLDAHRLWDLD